MAETWWATVFSERNSRPAISALRSPSATSATTSSSRVVSPAGFSRVAARGPGREGRDGRAVGYVRAASYGQPIAVQRSAAPS